jgi:hypothetical protein
MKSSTVNAHALALKLLRCESEQEVIETLQDARLWDQPDSWRLYGDRDGNYATIGNQQSRPEAALVEKIVNSVDARLMSECLARGIDPTSSSAPPTIRHAVSMFFEGRSFDGGVGGTVQAWPRQRQLEQSRAITIAVTGSKTAPNITISDSGEGQTPRYVPATFLSIDRSNKLRIPFVQGKFNMGGTGVLKFCGEHKLQLIISRRNPAIGLSRGTADDDETMGDWSVTVVRRDRPSAGAGAVRNSVFRYLAPVGCERNPGKGELLRFAAPTMPLFPEGNAAYSRDCEYGSCIKLYAYDMKGFKSHALMKGGLLGRLEVLLPEVALPVRVHECRDYRGHAGSFENTLVGLAARLAENRGGNLEEGYPTSATLRVHGHEMIATIYAFKEDKADSYRTNEGILFTINGQTHGHIPKNFFSRSSVKMGRLAKSLLVIVDCGQLSVDAREDLFMNSRDRLSNHELRKDIEAELEDLISHHQGLRDLRERRRSEEVAERLEDSRPLEQVLESLLRSSPTLERLFLLGQRLSRPFRSGGAGDREGGGGGAESGGGTFVGQPHPTFFKFFRKAPGTVLARDAELGRRCRIKFETDVVNDYFGRDANRGRYIAEIVEGPLDGKELDSNLTLHDGVANWSITLPEEALKVGDEIAVQCTVADDVIGEPLVNIARIRIIQKSTTGGGGGDRGSNLGEGQDGDNGDGNAGTGGKRGSSGPETPSGIAMPEIHKVTEGDSLWQQHDFSEHTACKIIEDAVNENGTDRSTYTFYVNVSNIALQTDMKNSREDVSLKEAKFVYGNVLVGLALIHQRRSRPGGETDTADGNGETPIEEVVESTTRALAPFLVPMIDYLGSLTSDDTVAAAQAGDEE